MASCLLGTNAVFTSDEGNPSRFLWLRRSRPALESGQAVTAIKNAETRRKERYSGDTYASYRSRSATRLIGNYTRSNSEQLLNESFSKNSFPNDDANKPEAWKSEEELTRLSYKGIAPSGRKSVDNGSLSRHMPSDLSSSWSPHYDPATRQDALASETDDEEQEEECLVSVKQRIQRLEETKSHLRQACNDGQKKRVPPPVPQKPRSLSLRGPADFPSFKSDSPEKQRSHEDKKGDFLRDTQRFKSTSDLSEADKDSGVLIEPNVTPSLHWMLAQQQQPKLKNLYSGVRGSDPDISNLKDKSNGHSSSFRQGCGLPFSQIGSSDGYSTLPSKKKRPMRASTGSAPILPPDEIQFNNKEASLIYRPIPPKPRSPKPVVRSSSGYHTLPRSFTNVKEVDRSSPEPDFQSGNVTSDEDGGFHEDPDISLSKSQLELMSSSFPSPQSSSNVGLRRNSDHRKLSLDNLVLSENQSRAAIQDNSQHSPSPLRAYEAPACSRPKPKPKPKQRHHQSNNNSKNQTNDNNTTTASAKRANFVVSHSRRPSQEELDFEEIAKDLSQNLREKDKELINVLNPNNKRAADFVKDLLENTHFNTKLQPEISNENAQNLDSQDKADSISNFYTPVIADRFQISIHRGMDNQLNEDNLIQKKEELRVSIVKKLDALREHKKKVEQEMDDVTSLGEQIGKSFDESCENSQDKLKFRSYVEDLETVIRLLMKLSMLLARAENNVRCLPVEADQKKRTFAVEKRNRLSRQHDEAKELKSDIDRRKEHITNLLGQHLSEEELKNFQYYIHMKLRLIVELQELEDKIYQGEEQLVALKRSIPLTLASMGTSQQTSNTSTSTKTSNK